MIFSPFSCWLQSTEPNARQAPKPFRAVLLVLMLAWPALCGALDPGKAAGMLTLHDRSVVLTHAFSWIHDGKELGHPELRVLLTDREVPYDLLAGPLALLPERWAATQRLTGLYLRADPRVKPPLWTAQPLIPGEARRYELGTLPYRLGPDGLRISGQIRVDGQSNEFSVDAQFDAPVFRDEPPRKILSGPRARASEPVKVLVAFNEAWRNADWKTLDTLMTAEKRLEMEPLIQGHTQPDPSPNAKERQGVGDALRLGMDDGAQTRADVLRVIVREGRAVILRKRRGPQNMKMEQGAWKVDY
jgi:hypothetical protein